MKKCYRCGESKPKSFFSKNKSKSDKLNSECKKCDYAINQEKVAKNQQKIMEFLTENPCVLCGEKNVLVLEFDHLRDKKHNVGYMVSQAFSWRSIRKEIEKCQVLCSNCHRIKTHEEQNSYRYKFLLEQKDEV